MDLEYPEMSSDEAAGEWRLALLDVRGVIAPEGRGGEGGFSVLGRCARFFFYRWDTRPLRARAGRAAYLWAVCSAVDLSLACAR